MNKCPHCGSRLGKKYIVELVERITETGCWIWMGSLHKGYGPHRESYELAKGNIPAGLQLDHLCRQKTCVNPAHLEPVTCRENIRRSPWHMRGPERARAYAKR